jgi:hypothetical protein
VNVAISEGETKNVRMFVSDGTTLKTRKDDADWREEKLAKTLKSGFAAALSRLGIWFWAKAAWPTVGQDIQAEADLQKVLEVSDFKAGPDEKNAETLTYKIELGAGSGKKETFEVKAPMSLCDTPDHENAASSTSAEGIFKGNLVQPQDLETAEAYHANTRGRHQRRHRDRDLRRVRT